MKIIVFGATGMVGQGAVRECLLDPGVERVLAIGRRPTGQQDAKLGEVMLSDLTDYASVRHELAGTDACFFCLGVSSAGMSEADYRRVTYDIAVAAARAVVEASPGATFVFVSGRGTDSTGTSRVMWARVKGATENAILAMPFKGKYAMRPGVIRPLHGIRSRTPAYRIAYALMTPLVPVLTALFPSSIVTTQTMGLAMLHLARRGYPKPILEAADIQIAAQEAGASTSA